MEAKPFATTCIIDDDEIYIFAFKHLMKTLKFTEKVVEFHDGQQALDYFRRAGVADIPQIMFIDINMPIVDGWQFLDEFQSMYDGFEQKPRVYVVSSSVYEDDIEKACTYKFVSGYITKPVNKDFLLKVINENSRS